jgi:hypothetical protein
MMKKMDSPLAVFLNPCTHVVPSPVLPLTAWVSMFYFMESATIICFARLVHFQGEGGCEKEYSLYACDNDEKDGQPLALAVFLNPCTHV